MTDMEKLVEKFNQWADERATDCQIISPGFSDSYRRSLLARIDTLNWAKTNLERLAKAVLAE